MVREYVLLTLAYHFTDFINILTPEGRHRSDFISMVLHHIATVALMLCCYISNIYLVGALIVYLMDTADIFVHFAKVFSETVYQGIAGVLFIGLCISWAWTRLYVFQYVVIPGVYKYHHFIVEELADIDSLCRNYNVFLLQILAILNVFWYYIFMQILWNLGTKGKSDDLI